MGANRPSQFPFIRLTGILVLAAMVFCFALSLLLHNIYVRSRSDAAGQQRRLFPPSLRGNDFVLFPAEGAGDQPARVAKSRTGNRNHAPGGDDLFNGTNVVRLRIDVPRQGLDVLRRYRWGGGNGGRERPEALATVREGDRVYTNVAVHLKGAAGSFQPVDRNPALTLNFDKFAPGQSFHGLRKISLNNSVQDSTYLAEKICRELFDEAGVPVPRADHAVVNLNGRDLGLYVLVEGFNKQFLKRYFNNVKGNLYDGGFCQEITDSLDTNSGDNPEDQSDRRALAAAAMDPNPSNRLARLEKVLDMDRFLTMIAMEVMLCHWDGYALNRNNWRLYHDLDTDKMVFMPHGLDQMFGVARGAPNTPIAPRHVSGLVARAVLTVPEGRRRYLQKVSYLATNVFDTEAIVQRVRDQAAKIRPFVSSGHAMQVNDFCLRIRQRGQSLAQQISTPAGPLPFDNQGTAGLTNWKSRTISGAPLYSSGDIMGGRKTLHVAISEGRAVGSWRTRAVVPAGRYRFEAQIKTKGVPEEGGDQWYGAGLRVSGGPTNQKLFGNADWTPYAYVFEVPEANTDVELICELRAVRGEAWFDLGSLKLVRL